MDMKRSLTVLMKIIPTMVAGGADKATSVEGIWQSAITAEITMELAADGTLTEYWVDDVTATYTYKQDGDKVIVNQNDDEYTLELDGDKLIYMDEVLYTRL
mgnify:CR=1 FL=1